MWGAANRWLSVHMLCPPRFIWFRYAQPTIHAIRRQYNNRARSMYERKICQKKGEARNPGIGDYSSLIRLGHNQTRLVIFFTLLKRSMIIFQYHSHMPGAVACYLVVITNVASEARNERFPPNLSHHRIATR